MKKLLSLLCLTGLLLSQAAADTTTDLVARYEFSSNLNDSTPNHNNGTDEGSLNYAKGVFGKGLLFNSYPDLMRISNTSLLKGETDTTVSMWISLKYTDREAGVISANTGSRNEYLIFINNDGTVSVELKGLEEKGSIKINDGFFHLLSIVTTAKHLLLYIDGKLDRQFDISLTPLDFDSSIWVGNDQDNTNGGWDKAQQFYGVLDDLRFYHRALSINDINELYQAGIGNILKPGSQYADVILDAYYSHANPDFNTFYGGDDEGGPKLVPLSYAIDKNETTAVCLPTGTYVTVGFSKFSIIDAPNQDDLFIVEGGAGGEDAKVYISSDFVHFTYLGLAQDDVTTSFDLASIHFTKPVVAIKVVGQDNGGSWPGFDLFEVKALPGALIKNTEQCKKVVKIYGKSPNTDKWILFSSPCDIPEGWESTVKKPDNTICDNAVVIMM